MAARDKVGSAVRAQQKFDREKLCEEMRELIFEKPVDTLWCHQVLQDAMDIRLEKFKLYTAATVTAEFSRHYALMVRIKELSRIKHGDILCNVPGMGYVVLPRTRASENASRIFFANITGSYGVLQEVLYENGTTQGCKLSMGLLDAVTPLVSDLLAWESSFFPAYAEQNEVISKQKKPLFSNAEIHRFIANGLAHGTTVPDGNAVQRARKRLEK